MSEEMSLKVSKLNLNTTFTNYPTYNSSADLLTCSTRENRKNPQVRPQTKPTLNDSQMSTGAFCP